MIIVDAPVIHTHIFAVACVSSDCSPKMAYMIRTGYCSAVVWPNSYPELWKNKCLYPAAGQSMYYQKGVLSVEKVDYNVT